MNNRFKKGSGCFICKCCKKRTRDTGGDNTDLKLCEKCYEIAGLENAINNGSGTHEMVKRLEFLVGNK